MMTFMRCAWARMSLIGPAHAASTRRIVGQGVEVARYHRQRGAQLVRGIRDEILAHGLEAHLAGHVAHQQQRLPGSVGNHLQRQMQVHLHRRTDDQRHRKIIAVQIVHEFRRADQVVDAQADVDRALQTQQARGLAVEPDDFLLAAQNDDAVRQRRGRAPQLAKQLHQPLFVKLLAPMQAHHLPDDIAPDSADVGRIELRAQPQPAVQPIQIEQLPGRGTGRPRPAARARWAGRTGPRTKPNSKMPASRASAKVHIAAMIWGVVPLC